MPQASLESTERIREFNRFYTRRIGLLGQGVLETRFPLAQARILFELGRGAQLTASDLINRLEMDPGYLSRILSGLEKEGLILRTPAEQDNRQRLLQLTPDGTKVFTTLNDRSREEIQALIKDLPEEDTARLLNAMETIEEVLGDGPPVRGPCAVRTAEPGDPGWVIHMHGRVYSQDYGWDGTFEGLVAEILARFIQQHDPEKERLWIAEENGNPVGSIMAVDAGEGAAQLRLLIVDPKARGRGIGMRLIDECVSFAKISGYRKIKLWTMSMLLEARHLYEKAGFVVTETEDPQQRFGMELAAEIWELPL